MGALTRRDVLKTSVAFVGLPLAVHAQAEAEPNLESRNLPRLSGGVVFRSQQLAKGQHSIRIVNKSGKPVVLDSFNIYTSCDPSLSKMPRP
jgi:hypothetical protein